MQRGETAVSQPFLFSAGAHFAFAGIKWRSGRAGSRGDVQVGGVPLLFLSVRALRPALLNIVRWPQLGMHANHCVDSLALSVAYDVVNDVCFEVLLACIFKNEGRFGYTDGGMYGPMKGLWAFIVYSL